MNLKRESSLTTPISILPLVIYSFGYNISTWLNAVEREEKSRKVSSLLTGWVLFVTLWDGHVPEVIADDDRDD